MLTFVRETLLGKLPQPRRTSLLNNGGRRYLLLVYGIVILGLVFVFSSSFPMAGRPAQGGDPYYFFTKQLTMVIAGLVAMLFVARLPTTLIARIGSLFAFPLGLGLMTYTAIVGREISGTRAWLELGGFQFQPSEFTKLAWIVFIATILGSRPLTKENRWRVALWCAGATGLMIVILLQQSDLGMAVLIGATALGIAMLAGVRPQYLLLGSAAAVFGGVYLASLEPYRWARIEAWLHPLEHLQGAGGHVFSMLITLARGGATGVGLGVSKDKWATLPVPHTDSIFCVIGGELGLWGGIAVIALMMMLALGAFQVARRSSTRLGWYLAASTGLALALQGFINIGVATALIPVTGLTLPFISHGGSSILSCLLATGVILAVAAEGQREGEV